MLQILTHIVLHHAAFVAATLSAEPAQPYHLKIIIEA